MCYQLSARENIMLGEKDEERLEEAILKTGAHEIISLLPHGFDTQLGRLFEGGQDLPYGQWQKIAMSRAFFREAEVIFLDEPTSALDPKAEAEVFKNFMELTKEKTAIFISHRLGSCQSADLILVLKNGQLIEKGTHQELMSIDSVYSEMFNTESKWYK
ncbi:ABC transporter, ATP-binding protein [Aneurinibacillus aneurinilyticus ATCC 12856]|uniref:ABC transporter, ATP-binding protein n=2 Tax=Aneurinibacillus aneurinilyticus TaxID=1391 RepID=U1WT75_ANEAE|nr:ABC transporter, ATP-binding protein [Aneurinibacillus aneurinilyticus ATCC 12856]